MFRYSIWLILKLFHTSVLEGTQDRSKKGMFAIFIDSYLGITTSDAHSITVADIAKIRVTSPVGYFSEQILHVFLLE